MDLDELIIFTDTRRQAYEKEVNEVAKTITLQEVLKRIQLASFTFDENGWFNIFFEVQLDNDSISSYNFMIRESKLFLFGYGFVIQREFEGEEVRKFYDKLVKKYEQHQAERKEVKF